MMGIPVICDGACNVIWVILVIFMCFGGGSVNVGEGSDLGPVSGRCEGRADMEEYCSRALRVV